MTNDYDHNWWTHYQLIYDVYPIACYIIHIKLLDNSAGIKIKNEQNYWIVVPDDITIDAEYNFKITMNTLGSGSDTIFPSSGYKTLVVGCTQSLTFTPGIGQI